MILRLFRAIVHDGKQDEFTKFFLETALPSVRSHAGLVSVSVVRLFETDGGLIVGRIWRIC